MKNNTNNTSCSSMSISLIPKNGLSAASWVGDSYPANTGDSLSIGSSRFDPFWPLDFWGNKYPGIFDTFTAIASPKFSVSKLNPWKEDGDKYTYETELPRFKANSLDITTEDGLLHIKAEQDSLKYYNSVNLPVNADVETVDAKLDHGVLYISIAKLASAKTKKIKVQTVK